MGLSENARKRRNEKKEKKMKERDNSNNCHCRLCCKVSDCRRCLDARAACDQGEASSSCCRASTSSSSSRRLIGPLRFEQHIHNNSDEQFQRAGIGYLQGQHSEWSKALDRIIDKYGDASQNAEDPSFYWRLFSMEEKKVVAKEEGSNECVKETVADESGNMEDPEQIGKEKHVMKKMNLPYRFGFAQNNTSKYRIGQKQSSSISNSATSGPVVIPEVCKLNEPEPFYFCNYNKKGTKMHFGLKMMKRWGWRKGRGLGKDEQGILEPWKVQEKAGKTETEEKATANCEENYPETEKGEEEDETADKDAQQTEDDQ